MRLTNPATGHTVDTSPEHAHAYLTQGWVQASPAPAKKATSPVVESTEDDD